MAVCVGHRRSDHRVRRCGGRSCWPGAVGVETRWAVECSGDDQRCAGTVSRAATSNCHGAAVASASGHAYTATRDAQFFALVARKLPPNANDRLPLVAQHTCDNHLAQGEPKSQLIDWWMQNGMTADQAMFFLDNIIQFYCPQFK